VQRQGQRQPRQPLRRRCAAAATTAATTATAAIAIILQLRFQSVMVTQVAILPSLEVAAAAAAAVVAAAEPSRGTALAPVHAVIRCAVPVRLWHT
jgi:hypothetical protein